LFDVFPGVLAVRGQVACWRAILPEQGNRQVFPAHSLRGSYACLSSCFADKYNGVESRMAIGSERATRCRIGLAKQEQAGDHDHRGHPAFIAAATAG